MKIYFIAGEPSGDLHTANLIKALKSKEPDLCFRGMGGDHFIEATGVQPIVHIRDTNVMGFIEVLKKLPKILKIMNKVKKDIDEFSPDALVLTDYPGFNMRMAKYAHQKGIKVFYYISPQVWAWKKGRIKQLKKYVNRMFCILPFEKDFYLNEGWDVDYVGHPLVDHVNNYTFDLKVNSLTKGKPLVALLPGSRKQEIKSILPMMLELSKKFEECSFVVAGAPTQSEAFYMDIMRKIGINIPIVFGKTYDLIKHAQAAIVTSGTATLETALIGTPQVVCYKGGMLSYKIAKFLVDIKYISLVNLILNRSAVKECIQRDMNVSTVADELQALLYDKVRLNNMKRDYEELRGLLEGGASEATASLILSLI